MQLINKKHHKTNLLLSRSLSLLPFLILGGLNIKFAYELFKYKFITLNKFSGILIGVLFLKFTCDVLLDFFSKLKYQKLFAEIQNYKGKDNKGINDKVLFLRKIYGNIIKINIGNYATNFEKLKTFYNDELITKRSNDSLVLLIYSIISFTFLLCFSNLSHKMFFLNFSFIQKTICLLEKFRIPLFFKIAFPIISIFMSLILIHLIIQNAYYFYKIIGHPNREEHFISNLEINSNLKAHAEKPNNDLKFNKDDLHFFEIVYLKLTNNSKFLNQYNNYELNDIDNHYKILSKFDISFNSNKANQTSTIIGNILFFRESDPESLINLFDIVKNESSKVNNNLN